jgi:GNAT superfamily N-acetyltransferase
MDIQISKISTIGIKFFINDSTGKEIARAYLYVLKNDLHQKPFGFMEDVFIDESLRGQGFGTKIVNQLIDYAKKEGCYKLVCTSRYSKPLVHSLYQKIGFNDHGKEFRIDF